MDWGGLTEVHVDQEGLLILRAVNFDVVFLKDKILLATDASMTNSILKIAPKFALILELKVFEPEIAIRVMVKSICQRLTDRS